MLIDSVFKTSKNYYPQMFVEKCIIEDRNFF